jgi:hypothetical protein
MYDPEYWALTQLNERQNPALYMQQFGQLAHANGLKFIEAPGRSENRRPGGRRHAYPGQGLSRRGRN